MLRIQASSELALPNSHKQLFSVESVETAILIIILHVCQLTFFDATHWSRPKVLLQEEACPYINNYLHFSCSLNQAYSFTCTLLVKILIFSSQ